jgi:hypothetical protein
MRNILFFGWLFAAAACGGSTVEVGGYDGHTATPGTDSADGASTTSAKVEIHIRASTSQVSHSDGLSGQTPNDQKIGIRKLTMLTSATDPAPLVVFDHASAAVEAGLNDKDDTVVATVPAATLKSGNYTIARVTISHVRYRVAATMHAVGQSVSGNFSNMQVLSDGSVVDGKPWNKGHYSFTFEVGGSALATQAGENGPLPMNPSGGGITMDTSGTETAYVFPILLPVTPNVVGDVKLVFEINTNENFRWQDQATAGYQNAIFDVTPTSYEPVKNFGANSFHVVAEFSQAAQSSNGSSDGYAPCAAKSPGDPCRLCAPTDPSCVETMALKVCRSEGTCR